MGRPLRVFVEGREVFASAGAESRVRGGEGFARVLVREGGG